MTFLPIAARELAVAARRPATYRLRAYGVVLALIVLAVVSKGNIPAGQLGHEILSALGIATLVFCMLAGLLLTANSIASEREGGTIGLLFLTDLKGYDIVLGKLTAHAISSFFGLLAVSPVLALPLLIGGVYVSEFLRLMLVFGSTLFLSLSLGLAVSAMTSDPKRALGGAILLMAAVAGFLPALWWLQKLKFSVWWLDILLWPSPAFAFRHSFDGWYRSRPGAEDFWHSLETIWLITVVCLAWASYITPRAWQAHGSKPRQLRKAKRKPLGWEEAEAENPFCRVTIRDWAPLSLANLFLAVAVPVWLCFFFLMPTTGKTGPPPAFLVCLFLAMALHVIVKLLMMVESVSRLNHDRNSGALELLLVTPLRVEAILEAPRAAQRAHFRWAIITLVLLNTAFLYWVFRYGNGLGMRDEDERLFAELFLGGIVALLADYKTVQWVGLWHGLSKRQAYKAVLLTAVQLLGPCWLFTLFIAFTKPNVNSGGVAFIFACWFGLGLVVDGISIAYARTKLLDGFRTVAAQKN